MPDTAGPCPAGYIYAYLCSELGQAQLTSRIYGAVVDEITEEQAQSVLIPVPKTVREKKMVANIDLAAKEAVLAKDHAVRLAEQSVARIGSLIPELVSRQTAEERDTEIARQRLAELKLSPERLVQGSKLRNRLARLEP